MKFSETKFFLAILISCWTIGAWAVVNGQLPVSESELRNIQLSSQMGGRDFSLGKCLDVRRAAGMGNEWSKQTLVWPTGREQDVIELKQTARGRTWSETYFDYHTLEFVQINIYPKPGAPARVFQGQAGYVAFAGGCEADITRR